MGAGASTNVKEELTKATEEDLKKAVAELTPEAKKKLLAALEEKNLEAEEKSDPFAFTSGLKDCCSTNPEIYKVVAEIPNARLVEMTCPPGGEDKPHEHPAHSMFFIKGGKLSITDIKDGKNGEPHEVEIPDGAPPIFPAGAHQVKNVGEAEVKVLFVEAYPTCKPCGDVKEMITPFKVKPDCYKILAENDDWITGMVTMEPGTVDGLHHHKDHLIYVLEGDGVTLFPAEDGKDGHAVPIKPGMAIPAPMAAADGLFAKHIMKNTGTIPLKMVFFEMKL